jgi:heme-degrading monooxygenase HmoA
MSDNHTTTISTDDELATLVYVFEVEPSKQDQLVELLEQKAEAVIRHRPGFISVNLLKSDDGTRVINYAQWRSLEDIKATTDGPDAEAWTRRTAELAKTTRHVYSVSSIHHP